MSGHIYIYRLANICTFAKVRNRTVKKTMFNLCCRWLILNSSLIKLNSEKALNVTKNDVNAIFFIDSRVCCPSKNSKYVHITYINTHHVHVERRAKWLKCVIHVYLWTLNPHRDQKRKLIRLFSYFQKQYYYNTVVIPDSILWTLDIPTK